MNSFYLLTSFNVFLFIFVFLNGHGLISIGSGNGNCKGKHKNQTQFCTHQNVRNAHVQKIAILNTSSFLVIAPSLNTSLLFETFLTPPKPNPYPSPVVDEVEWSKLFRFSLYSKSMLPDTFPVLLQGDGVTVAIVDTGIDWQLADFQTPGIPSDPTQPLGSRVVRLKNTKEGTHHPHGTLMAQFVGSSVSPLAVAKKVTLVDLSLKTKAVTPLLRPKDQATTFLGTAVDVINFSTSYLQLRRWFMEASARAWYTDTLPRRSLMVSAIGNSGHQQWREHEEEMQNALSVGAFHLEYMFQFLWQWEHQTSQLYVTAAYLSTAHDWRSAKKWVNQPVVMINPFKPSVVDAVFWRKKTVMVFCLQIDMRPCQEVVQQAVVHHARAVVMISDATQAHIDTFQPQVSGCRIPVIFLSWWTPSVQDQWRQGLQSTRRVGSLHMTWKMKYTSFAFPSPHSALGLTPTLDIKPDIMAIGGPFQMQLTEKMTFGSSIATARVSGMLALWVEYQRKRKLRRHQDLFDLVRYTAVPYVYDPKHVPPGAMWHAFRKENTEFQGWAASVVWQGAGLLQFKRMIYSMERIRPSKLALGYLAASPPSDVGTTDQVVRKASVVLENLHKKKVTYTWQHQHAVALWTMVPFATQAGQFLMKKLSLHVELYNALGETVTTIQLHPQEKVNLHVSFRLPPSLMNKGAFTDFTFLSGYLVFLPIKKAPNKKKKLTPPPPRHGAMHVPYMLLLGDLSMYPYLNETLSLRVMSVREYREKRLPLSSHTSLKRNSVTPRFLVDDPESRPVFCLYFTVSVTQLNVVIYEMPQAKMVARFDHVSASTILQGSELVLPVFNNQLGWDGCVGLGTHDCRGQKKYRFCLEAAVEGVKQWNVTQLNTMYCTNTFIVQKEEEKKKETHKDNTTKAIT